jgi:hypothetical protein
MPSARLQSREVGHGAASVRSIKLRECEAHLAVRDGPAWRSLVQNPRETAAEWG